MVLPFGNIGVSNKISQVSSNEAISRQEMAELAYNVALTEPRLLKYVLSFAEKTEMKATHKSIDPESNRYEYTQEEYTIFLLWLLAPKSRKTPIKDKIASFIALHWIINMISSLLH